MKLTDVEVDYTVVAIFIMQHAIGRLYQVLQDHHRAAIKEDDNYKKSVKSIGKAATALLADKQIKKHLEHDERMRIKEFIRETDRLSFLLNQMIVDQANPLNVVSGATGMELHDILKKNSQEYIKLFMLYSQIDGKNEEDMRKNRQSMNKKIRTAVRRPVLRDE